METGLRPPQALRHPGDPHVPPSRSTSATAGGVPVIPQKELQNNVANVLRRAETGKEFTITVAGRPVAQLGRARRREWVSGPDLTRIWDTPAPQTLEQDLEHFPAGLV